MVQNITISADDLVARANTVVFIDLGDIRELAGTGCIKGGRHVPRGMLGIRIDPQCPHHNSLLTLYKTFVFYYANGWHSALAAKCEQDMGLHSLAQLDGCTTSRLASGGPID